MQITPNKAAVGQGAPTSEDIARFAGGWSLWLDSVEYTKKGLVCAFYVLNGTDEKCSQITNLGLTLCVGAIDNEIASRQFSKVSASVPAKSCKLVKITLPVHSGVSVPDLSQEDFIYFEAGAEAKLKGKKTLYPYKPQTLPDFPVDEEALRTSITVDGECWIEGLDDDSVEVLVIPAEIDGYPVVRVNVQAFYKNTSLRRVVLPEGLQSIADSAFEGCENLEEVVIPSTVTEIGGLAFNDCGHLKNVTLPEGLQTIEKLTFQNCAALKRANIPSTVTAIEANAFYGCKSLESLSLPEGLERVERGAFAECDSIKSVHIPASLKSIGLTAFGYCDSLTEITVDAANPNYVSLDGALYTGRVGNLYQLIACPAGKTGGFLVQEGATWIYEEAFGGCAKLTSIDLAETVAKIDPRAFVQCHGLTSMDIPSQVGTVYGKTFCDCQELQSITVRSAATHLDPNFVEDCPKFHRISGSAGSGAEDWFKRYGETQGVSFDYIGE